MRTLLVALVLFMGCGGEGSGPAQTGIACARRSGLYRATFTFQSGNCGPQNEAVVNTDTPQAAGCTGTPAPLDGCHVESDVTCPAPVALAPGTITERGSVQWSADGARGTGTVFIDVEAAVICQGIYGVTFTKL